ESLLNMINELLDLSKIEAGEISLEHIDFYLHHTMAGVLKLLGGEGHKKGLELIFGTAREVPDFVVGDAARLQQVIINLVGNAIKFTEVGEVVVRIEKVTELADGLVCLHFSVRDSGIGIPAAKLDSIFEPFVQADSST